MKDIFSVQNIDENVVSVYQPVADDPGDVLPIVRFIHYRCLKTVVFLRITKLKNYPMYLYPPILLPEQLMLV
jgi:hypothetical protein